MTFVRLIICFLFLNTTWAALGPLVELSEIPQSICKITLTKTDQTSFHCSGILLDSYHVKTAAHCLEKDVEKITVSCETQEAKVITKTVANDFSFKDIKKEIDYRRFDQAVLELESKIDLPLVPMLTNKNEINTFMKQSDECAFFGFGFTPWTKGTGALHGVKSPANLLKWHNEVLVLNAPYHAVSMIGDSGASLLCRKSGGRWYNIGTVSAHSWEKETIVAPNNFLPHTVIAPSIYEAPKSIIEKDQVEIGLEKTFWVSPFSEFIYNNKTYNTVDRVLVEFTVEEIHGDQVKGKLFITSSSQYYLCIEQNLCHIGALEDVTIDRASLVENYQVPNQFLR